jgi:hypothetical protein
VIYLLDHFRSAPEPAAAAANPQEGLVTTPSEDVRAYRRERARAAAAATSSTAALRCLSERSSKRLAELATAQVRLCRLASPHALLQPLSGPESEVPMQRVINLSNLFLCLRSSFF